MSEMGQSRRFDYLPPTSALPPSTDIVSSARQVRFVPQPDIPAIRPLAVLPQRGDFPAGRPSKPRN